MILNSCDILCELLGSILFCLWGKSRLVKNHERLNSGLMEKRGEFFFCEYYGLYNIKLQPDCSRGQFGFM